MNATDRIVPVILAGGQGTRLWPMSRAARPKQFLQLTGPLSLFQETLQRVSDPQRFAPPIIVTNAEYRFLVAEQAHALGLTLSGVLLEPMPRNTAAAIASAAVYVEAQLGANSILYVLPSDHAVIADAGYDEVVEIAAASAREGRLVTFGITPKHPETGYGYIEGGAPISKRVLQVSRFVEKPDRAGAEAMIAQGNFFWNSGMFMLPTRGFLAECRALAPEIHAAAATAVAKAVIDFDFVRLDPETFAATPSISVDYAIFEKTAHAAVVPVSFTWSDLGSWDAVWQSRERDEAANVSVGPVTLSNTRNSLVFSERAHVAVEGLDDVAILASEDAIYVGRLSEAQKVGAMVKVLRANPETTALTEIHRTAYRPWGGYSSVVSGERFQVKRLFVNPGKRLSLQRHFHRSEHWVVVRGTAEVTLDGQVHMLTENQSIYLPLGCAHRLANPGKILLELIEVQTGSYLGEDDIVRIEDEFGRK